MLEPITRPEQTTIQVVPQPCVLVALSICLGIITDRVLDFSWWVYAIVGFGCCVVWGFSFRKQSLVISGQALLLAWASLAGFWHHSQWNWYPETNVQTICHSEPKLVCVQVRLSGEPRHVAVEAQDVLSPFPATAKIQFTADLQKVRDKDRWREISGEIELVLHQGRTDLRCGDTVKLFGRLSTCDSTRNPGQFDFRELYRSRRRLSRIHVYQNEAVAKVGEGSHVSLVRLRSRIRRQLDAQVWSYLSPEQAGMASAILLGNREQLNSQRRERFLLTGTVHLLAISGLHIGILAGVFFMFFRVGLLSRSTALLCTIAFVMFFAWLVEFRPPVVRASILIGMFCMARLCGREGFSFNLLALAGAVVLAANPMDLFQIGPQLSFLAVASLIFCRRWTEPVVEEDPLQRLINKTRSGPVRTMRWLKQKTMLACKMSALIWLFSMPLVALRFHLVAPVALVANPLLMIPIAFALYAGLGVLVLGWWPAGAAVCGSICDQSLSWIELIVEGSQEVAFGHFWPSGPSELAVLCFYLLVFAFLVYLPTRVPGRWICTLGLIWLVAGWVVPDWYQMRQEQNRDSVEVLFVDTGHGGSTLIKLPSGQVTVYDAGSLASTNYGVENISAVLWNEGVKHIHALVISHADIDHFNAVVDLSRRFSIGVVYLSPFTAESDATAVKFLFSELRQNGVEIRQLTGGKQLRIRSEDVAINVLGPPAHGTFTSDNSESLVLSIEAYGKRLLLPGDLEGPGLSRLLKLPSKQYDVVLAPHHGSRNSDPVEFGRWAQPDHVVISASSRRIHWQTVEQFQRSGCSVWITGRDGAIRCTFDEGPVRLQKWIRESSNSASYYSNRGFENLAR